MTDQDILPPEKNENKKISSNLSEEDLSLIIARIRDDKPKATLSSIQERRFANFIAEDHHLISIINKIEQQLAYVSIVKRDFQIYVQLSDSSELTFPSLNAFLKMDRSTGAHIVEISVEIDVSYKVKNNEDQDRIIVDFSLRTNIEGYELQMRSTDPSRGEPKNFMSRVAFSDFVIGKNIIKTLVDWFENLPVQSGVKAPLNDRTFLLRGTIGRMFFVMPFVISGFFVSYYVAFTEIDFTSLSLGGGFFLGAALFLATSIISAFFATKYARATRRSFKAAAFSITNGDKERVKSLIADNQLIDKEVSKTINFSIVANLISFGVIAIIQYFFV